MKYTLSVLVENQPGVLSKVAGLFARRGFNIDSLAVGVTENSAISRMTIVVNGDEYIVEQVEKQLNKGDPRDQGQGTGDRPLYQLRTIPHQGELQHEAARGDHENSRADAGKIVDVSTTSLTLQLADNTEHTETLISLLHPFGIKEICRTGTVAMEKGPTVTRQKQ